MGRTVLVLAALCMSGATCCGDWEDPDVEIAPLESVKVALFHCQIDPMTGELVNPNCEPMDPMTFPLRVQVVHAESGAGLCGVEVHAESYEQAMVPRVVPRALESPQISDKDGWVTFEVEVALGAYLSPYSGALLLTAAEEQTILWIQPGA